MDPIFVTGASRSGKTLMRWMLSSHSRITVTPRAQLWPEFAGRFGSLGQPDNLERCIRVMLRRSQIAALETDADRLRRDFAQGAPTYARLFALVHQQHAERCGKVRWGDQSPQVERYADELLAAYPEARVLHMVRDPRDRHAALLERGRRRVGAAGETAARWLSSVTLALRHAQRYPGRYRIVRYETVVSAPETTMRELCAFLDEVFEPAMLRMEQARRYDGERASGDGNPISARYVGQYRERVRRSELEFIHAAAGTQMSVLGYPSERAEMGLRDRARCAVGWPINTLRLVTRR